MGGAFTREKAFRDNYIVKVIKGMKVFLLSRGKRVWKPFTVLVKDSETEQESGSLNERKL